MALKVGELYATLGLNSQGLNQGLDQAKTKLGMTGQQMNQLKTRALTGLGVGLAGLGAASFKFSNDFNKSMANVATLIPGNTKRVKELSGAVQRMAMATGVATGDISEGLYQVVSAFGDTADTAKILEMNVKAAVAGVASTTDAINLTSAVTKAYGDTSAEAVGHVSDLAFTAVKLGQTTFPELANSIGRVTPLAQAMAVSQEELFGVMATATGVTGKASEVSTQLRGVLQGLMAPTESMSSLISEMGFESGEAMVKGIGLQKSIDAIVGASKDSGQPLQSYIGSIEGQTLALTLSGEQSDTFTDKLKAMADVSGSTEEAFEKQTDGVNKMGHAYNRAKQYGAVFLQKMGVVSPLIMATGAIVTMTAQMQAFGLSMTVVRTVAASTWTAVLGPVGLVIAAIALVAGAVYLIIKYWEPITGFFKNLWNGVCSVFSTVWEWLKKLFLNYTPQGLIIKHWDVIGPFFSNLWDGVKEGAVAAWEWLKQMFLNYTATGLVIKYWEPLKEFFTNLWDGVYDITIGKLQAMIDWIKNALGAVGDIFQGLYDRLVGHSIVPDMMADIQAQAEKLEGSAMAEPFQRAANAASESMAGVERLPEGDAANAAPGAQTAIGDAAQLTRIAATAQQMLAELKILSRETAGAIST